MRIGGPPGTINARFYEPIVGSLNTNFPSGTPSNGWPYSRTAIWGNLPMNYGMKRRRIVRRIKKTPCGCSYGRRRVMCRRVIRRVTRPRRRMTRRVTRPRRRVTRRVTRRRVTRRPRRVTRRPRRVTRRRVMTRRRFGCKSSCCGNPPVPSSFLVPVAQRWGRSALQRASMLTPGFGWGLPSWIRRKKQPTLSNFERVQEWENSRKKKKGSSLGLTTFEEEYIPQSTSTWDKWDKNTGLPPAFQPMGRIKGLY